MSELVTVSLTGFVEGCHDRVDNSGLCQKGWEAKKQVPDIRGGGSMLPYTTQLLDLVSKFGGHVGPWFGNTGDTQWGGAILVGACGPLYIYNDPEQLDLCAKGPIRPRVLRAHRHFVVKMGDPSGGMVFAIAGHFVLWGRGVAGAERGGNMGCRCGVLVYWWGVM